LRARADTDWVDVTTPGYRTPVAPAERAARLEAELAAARAALEQAIGEPSGRPLSPDLVSVAAEELRVPATAISGYLQLLLDGEAGPVEPAQQHMLESAVFHTQRMLDLIDDLVMLGALTPTRRRGPRLDICELVRGRALDISPRAVARKVRLDLQLGDCRHVAGDAPVLGRAVECLLEQAIMFSPPSSIVQCRVHELPEGVAIEVADQGISPDLAAFDALMDGRRAGAPDDARTMLASRLGLALVRMVAEAHGGRAEAHAEPPVTTVRMVLPVVR
jgi:two-component system phosphate regulon sensor histidine kinase PhoR